jgi:hypothetical protein
MSHPELTPTKPARHSTGVSANCGPRSVVTERA